MGTASAPVASLLLTALSPASDTATNAEMTRRRFSVNHEVRSFLHGSKFRFG